MATGERPLKSVTDEEPTPGSKKWYRQQLREKEAEISQLRQALSHEPATPVDDLFDTIVDGGQRLLDEAKKYRPVVEGFLKKLTTKE